MAPSSPDIAGLLKSGNLADAVAQATARVRSAAGDHAARTVLAELLCLEGSFGRAEAQLAIVAQQTVDRPVAIARMRHLIRAAMARDAWFQQGAVPNLLDAPTPLQRAAIELAVAMRAGEAERVATLLEQAEALRPHVAGQADEVPFDDWRDVDDRSAWFLEVLTHDGGYMWVDPVTVAGLRFTPASRPIDLLWRDARMALHDGRVAEIVVPAQYVSAVPDQANRLAQSTDWHDGPGGACTGSGQRLWLLGEDARGVMELGEITFASPA